jgi:SAM-dependent methyltransferase
LSGSEKGPGAGRNLHIVDFRTPSEEEIQKVNQRQQDRFGQLIHVFDPPLPEGVPERLQKIVASAGIAEGHMVLDVGAGTGILVPLIQAYRPAKIFACDLSPVMLAHLKKQYPHVETIASDVRELDLPDGSLNVVFLNACYSNIIDKPRSFQNISRMMKSGGRMVISHPMGKSFIDSLKKTSPFPLDDFPEEREARILFRPYQFHVHTMVDEENLYILVATKQDDAVARSGARGRASS